MHALLIERIDDLELRAPNPEVDAEAYDLMEAFAQGGEEIRILVERYCASHSLSLVRALALLIRRKADSAVLDTALLVFTLIENLLWKNDTQILQSCLQAINLQLLHGYTWSPPSQPPSVLFPFLRYCLNYTSSLRYATFVQQDAIQVLARLYNTGFAEQAFRPVQHTWLRDKLLHLSARKDDLLDSEMAWLPEFLNQEHLFIHSPLLDQLDIIAKGDPDVPGKRDEDASDLLERLGQRPEELWILIERYGDTHSVAIVHELARLVAQKAESPTAETAALIFYLIEQLHWKIEPITAMYCLTAIQQQFSSDYVWVPSVQSAPGLYPFLVNCLRYCLNHANGDRYIIQHKLMRILSLLDDKKLLEEALHPAERTVLRDKLLALSAHRNDLLESDQAWVSRFVERDSLFVQPSLLGRLDELEQHDPALVGGIDEEVFDLLAAFGQTPEDLLILIERYGSSHMRTMIGALAILVRIKAEIPKWNIVEMIFSFIEQLHYRDDRMIIQNCLMALRQQIRFNHIWYPLSPSPAILYSFLMHCLHQVDVQRDALEVLITFYEKDLLQQVFDSAQLTMLHDQVLQIVGRRTVARDLIGLELSGLIHFLEKRTSSSGTTLW